MTGARLVLVGLVVAVLALGSSACSKDQSPSPDRNQPTANEADSSRSRPDDVPNHADATAGVRDLDIPRTFNERLIALRDGLIASGDHARLAVGLTDWMRHGDLSSERRHNLAWLVGQFPAPSADVVGDWIAGLRGGAMDQSLSMCAIWSNAGTRTPIGHDAVTAWLQSADALPHPSSRRQALMLALRLDVADDIRETLRRVLDTDPCAGLRTLARCLLGDEPAALPPGEPPPAPPGFRALDNGSGFYEHVAMAAAVREHNLPAVTAQFAFVPRGYTRVGLDRLGEDVYLAVGPLLVARTEVVIGVWTALGGGAQRMTPGRTLAHPVVERNANAVIRWCDSNGLRLPSEAEWQLAARGDRNWIYPFGDDPARLPEFSTLATEGNRPPGWIEPAVATLAANRYGLHDVCGGVWEWCADHFAMFDLPRLRDQEQLGAFEPDPPHAVRGGGAGPIGNAVERRTIGSDMIRTGFRPVVGLRAD